jgi:hypothetical protein
MEVEVRPEVGETWWIILPRHTGAQGIKELAAAEVTQLTQRTVALCWHEQDEQGVRSPRLSGQFRDEDVMWVERIANPSQLKAVK